jgi:hypothetical protein
MRISQLVILVVSSSTISFIDWMRKGRIGVREEMVGFMINSGTIMQILFIHSKLLLSSSSF